MTYLFSFQDSGHRGPLENLRHRAVAGIPARVSRARAVR